MAGNYAQLLDIINNPTQHGLPAWDNNAKQIEGETIQQYLLYLLNSLTVGYQFMGVATPSTSPGTPDQNVFYIGGAGTYANFGTSITVRQGQICIFKWNGSWTNTPIEIANSGFVNVNDVNGRSAAYESASAARSAVPTAYRKSGLNITYLLNTGWVIEQNLDATVETWTNDASWKPIGRLMNSVEYTFESGSIGINGEDVPDDQLKRTSYIDVSDNVFGITIFGYKNNYNIACYGTNQCFIGWASNVNNCYTLLEGTQYIRMLYVTSMELVFLYKDSSVLGIRQDLKYNNSLLFSDHKKSTKTDTDNFVNWSGDSPQFNICNYVNGWVDKVYIAADANSVLQILVLRGNSITTIVDNYVAPSNGIQEIALDCYINGIVGVKRIKGSIYVSASGTGVMNNNFEIANTYEVQMWLEYMLSLPQKYDCDFTPICVADNGNAMESSSHLRIYYQDRIEEIQNVVGCVVRMTPQSAALIYKLNIENNQYIIIASVYSKNGGIEICHLGNITLSENERIGIRLLYGKFYYNTNERYHYYGLLTTDNTTEMSKGELSFGLLTNSWNIKDKNKGILMMSDFRWVKDYPLQVFQESLFSGINPLQLNQFELTGETPNAEQYYTGNAMRLTTTSIGEHKFSLTVRDSSNKIIDCKRVNYTVVNNHQKLTEKESIKVLFIGDSLIHANQNEIGKEYLRLLATNSEGGTVGDVIYPNSFGSALNKIELQGELQRQNDSAIKYQILNSFTIAMIGKRGATIQSESDNPFYNYESTEPDEIGADGFNKRVDFGWYFNKIGGVPDIIYLCCGPNDIAGVFKWDYIQSVKETPVLLDKFLTKLKTYLISVGASTIVKVFNHQFYPLHGGSVAHNFQATQQRKCYAGVAPLYAELIKSDAYNNWVDYIPCGEKFDTINGYDYSEYNANNRCSLQIKVPYDAVHMNIIGACQYADCLACDFIADARFD